MGVTDAQQVMTVAEFWAQYADERVELIRGEVVEKMPNAEHGKIALLIGMYLMQYALERNLGWGRVETKFRLSEHVSRIPDVSFVTAASEAQITDPTQPVPFPPEMAIEINSRGNMLPGETIRTVRDKMDDYRAAGTEVLWLVYPDSRAVEVHYLQEDRLARFGYEDTLQLEAVLPGFALPLSNIFVD